MSQVRSNGLIVFVPKYGIEGPVYLDDAPPADGANGASGSSSSGGGVGGAARRKGGAPPADSNFVYDEEKQVSTGVNSTRGRSD